MQSTLTMARTLLKIFSRDRQAIFFTLFFPITFMAIFGFINTGEDEPIEIGIVEHDERRVAAEFEFDPLHEGRVHGKLRDVAADGR